jgi:Fe-S cluster assembly ATPase SufC
VKTCLNNRPRTCKKRPVPGFPVSDRNSRVSMVNFLKTAINEMRKHRGEKPLSASDFLKKLREKKELVEIDSSLTNRSVNEGFSGGEKKRMRFSRWQCLNQNSQFWMKPIRDLI